MDTWLPAARTTAARRRPHAGLRSSEALAVLPRRPPDPRPCMRTGARTLGTRRQSSYGDVHALEGDPVVGGPLGAPAATHTHTHTHTYVPAPLNLPFIHTLTHPTTHRHLTSPGGRSPLSAHAAQRPRATTGGAGPLAQRDPATPRRTRCCPATPRAYMDCKQPAPPGSAGLIRSRARVPRH
jgi:hypothetical protein